MENHPWRVLTITAITLAITAITASRLLAQGPLSEPFESRQSVLENPNQVIGDDPDEDGYVGQVRTLSGTSIPSEPATIPSPMPVQVAGEPRPDEEGYSGLVDAGNKPIAQPSEPMTSSTVNWDLLINKTEPDQDETNLQSVWSSFQYFFAAGSTMRPRDSNTGWKYESKGCVSATRGTESFTLQVHLPEGSRVDYIRIYFFDASAEDSTAWLTAYDGSGSFSDLTFVTSTGEEGYGTNLSGLLEHVITNQLQSYVLNWQSITQSSDMQLCGLRIAYRLPG